MKDLSVSLIQANLAWEDKVANLKNFETHLASASHGSIVILPEMFTTAFSMNASALAEKMNGPTFEWMRNQSASKRIILTGSFIAEEEGKFFNRMIWMMPDGNFGIYDKRHLFAFSGEDKYFTPGRKRIITKVNGWRILLQVCYDLRFPVWARQQPENSEPEYDVIIYIANWPEKRNHAWKSLLIARSIENQSYVIGVNRVGKDAHNFTYSGDSMIVNPLGDILYHKAYDEDVHHATLSFAHLQEIRTKYPFLKDRDSFTIEQ